MCCVCGVGDEAKPGRPSLSRQTKHASRHGWLTNPLPPPAARTRLRAALAAAAAKAAADAASGAASPHAKASYDSAEFSTLSSKFETLA